MTSKNQVSPVIRISRGERDASARATHLEAANGKFLLTTNERKQMSTKTNFKRIALVAVAALGIGFLSAIPSTAAVSGVTTTVTNGAATLRSGSTTLVNTDTGTATGATVSVSALISAATDSVTVSFFNKNTLSTTGLAYLALVETTTSSISRVSKAGLGAHNGALAVSGGEAFDSSTSGVTTFGLNSSSGVGNVGATFALFLDTSTATGGAGTYTYSVVVNTRTVNSGTVQVTEFATDVSIVVAANTNDSTTPSAATTNVFIGNASGDVADEILTPQDATASVTAAGYVNVVLKNAASTSGVAKDTVTVTVTGAGIVYDGTASGKSLTGYKTGTTSYEVRPDGQSGTSTITVVLSRTGQTFTKTMSFYGTAKTITATVGHPLLKVGTNSGAVRATAVDASGNPWTGSAWIVASSAADALIAGSATTPVACSYSTTDARHNCNVTAIAPGAAKFKVINASTVALATATSNEVTVTVSAATPATVKLSFDKTTYAPNERARIYITPLDSAGKEIQALDSQSLLAAGGITVNGTLSYTGSTTTAESLTATSITTSGSSSSTTGAKAGSAFYTVYMPSAGGVVTLTATGGSALPVAGQVAITATATVTDSGAAALAAVTALATTVASLRTLIVTLTNLVLKIQKKVRA
jgi:hypothetical protein